jgi:hypothetical protein
LEQENRTNHGKRQKGDKRFEKTRMATPDHMGMQNAQPHNTKKDSNQIS